MASDRDQTLVAAGADKKEWQSVIVFAELSDMFVEIPMEGFPGTPTLDEQLIGEKVNWNAVSWTNDFRKKAIPIHFMIGDEGWKCRFFARVETGNRHCFRASM